MVDRRLAVARELKKKATALRNRREFMRAQQALDQAIQVLETPCSDSSSDAREVRAELADTYGMKGGVFRRTGEVDNALAAYEAGARIEENDNLSTTYNRSNVITLSITAQGKSPMDPEIRARLASLIEHLEVETAGPRSDEWWAWSDLAQFLLLNGDPAKARESYGYATRTTGATDQEIKRHVTILGELADKTELSAPEISGRIRAAISELLR